MDSKNLKAVLGAWSKSFRVSDIVGVAFLISIFLALPYFILFAKPKLIIQSDLVSFITGASMVKDGVKDKLYDLAVQERFQNAVIYPFEREAVLPFKNFAPFAIAFSPFVFLPLKVGYIIFAFANLGLLTILAYLAAKKLEKLTKFRFWFLAPFIFLPTILSVILGQLSIILALLYFLIYKFEKENNSTFSGILSGMLLLKPQYIIVVPFIYLLTKDKKKFVLAFLLTTLAVFLSSLLLSGPKALASYPSFLLATENASFAQRAQRMFTVSSTIYYNFSSFGASYVGALCANAILYLIALLFFAKKKKSVPFDLAFVSATIFSLLFAVHVLEHDLSILLICVLILINLAQKYRKLTRKLYLSASILFIMPLVVLIISPALGSLLALAIALALLFEKTTFSYEKG